jgi:hypothetical protein
MVFAKILGNIHQCSDLESGYTFKWLLDPDPHSEWKIFAKTKILAKIFVKTKIRLKKEF